MPGMPSNAEAGRFLARPLVLLTYTRFHAPIVHFPGQGRAGPVDIHP